MTGRVEGKVALVTGAARGQGRAHALTLARNGADIIAVDIAAQIDTVAYPLSTPDDLAETVKEIEELDRRGGGVQAAGRPPGQAQPAGGPRPAPVRPDDPPLRPPARLSLHP